MDKKMKQKMLLRVFAVFIVINSGAVAAGNWLDKKGVDHFVLVGANSLLFFLVVICLQMHIKALADKNPNVFVRSIMAATLLKLVVILGAVIAYLLAAGSGRSLGAVFAGLGLYILYTIIEVRAALQMNRLKDGSN